MELISYLADPAPGETKHMVMNVVSSYGNFTAGIGIGRVDDGRILLTDVAAACCQQLADIEPKRDYTLHMVEIASSGSGVDARIESALSSAKDRDRLFFLCGDMQTYEQVYNALNPHVVSPYSDVLH